LFLIIAVYMPVVAYNSAYPLFASPEIPSKSREFNNGRCVCPPHPSFNQYLLRYLIRINDFRIQGAVAID
jgi:hypothetical protein